MDTERMLSFERYDGTHSFLGEGGAGMGLG